MIQLYNATDTKYTSGVNITRYCQKAYVTEILNGSFILELELIYNAMLWNTISREMQIKVPTHRGELTFRIVDMTKDLSVLKIRARHLLWDLSNNLIEDIYCKTMDGDTAIKKIVSSGNYQTKWTASSDIIIPKNCRIVQEYMLDALMGDLDNSFRNRWGGELTAYDYSFTINMRRGKREAREIKFRKDISGFEYFEDISELATRIMPIGFDGLTLPEKYIDSPLIDKYAQIYIKKVKFESIKVKQNEEDEGYTSKLEAYEALREAVAFMYETQEVDKPKQNFRANMVLLRQSEQYAKYNIQALEDIQLGDAIDVNLGEYNITSSKRCISITYDCMKEQYIEVELGDFKGYEELGNDYQTPEINIDDKLEELRTGMYFLFNESNVTIDNKNEFLLGTTTFAAVSSTHLNLAITITGSVPALAQASMRLVLNNENLDMKPAQTIQEGYFTWTVSCPLLFIKPNIPYMLNIYVTTDQPITVPKGCFSATIFGQAVSGASSEFPAVDIVEQITVEDFEAFARGVNSQITSSYNQKEDEFDISFIVPDIYNLEDRVQIETINANCSRVSNQFSCHDNIELVCAYTTFAAYWTTSEFPKLTYDSNNYYVTSSKVVVNQHIFEVKNQAIRDIEHPDMNLKLFEALLPVPSQYKIVERKL